MGTLREMSRKDRAREAGRSALASVRGNVRRAVNERLAGLLRSDPDMLASAIELGLVRREWIDDPAHEPIGAAPPTEVMQRFLEREVERRPSVLSELGLSALQILASRDETGLAGDGSAHSLAIVFADLEGFTSFTEKHGDDAAHELLQALNRVVGPVVRSRGGTIVKRLGDGVLLTFPGPEAAVLAALELVDAVTGPLAMRVGVHWGEAFESRGDVVGHDVNVAARVCDVSRGGEVLVTVVTRDAARDALTGRVEFGRVGRRKVKGLDEPVRVCRATRIGPPTLEIDVVRSTDGEA